MVKLALPCIYIYMIYKLVDDPNLVRYPNGDGKHGKDTQCYFYMLDSILYLHNACSN